jgi:cytochrome c oxidase assembly protein subunit 15
MNKVNSSLLLSIFACALALIVIALGAFTRLSDAGLGCPDWPGCYGHLLWPTSTEEVLNANKAFPDTPVAHDKTWPEMIHRYFASMLGLLIVIIAVFAYQHRIILPLKHALLLVFMVILQGAFGMWTVTLKLWPQVVTAHLLGGISILALLGLYVQRMFFLRGEESILVSSPAEPGLNFTHAEALPYRSALGVLLPSWALLCVFLVFIQLALGAWTSSNYAAVACPDFPRCQGQWWPDMNMNKGFDISQEVGPNYLGGTMDNASRIAIHQTHRIGALVCTLAVSILFFLINGAAKKQSLSPYVLCLARCSMGFLCLQLVLGVSNVILHFPMFLAVAHNLGAALLFLCLVLLFYSLVKTFLMEKEMLMKNSAVNHAQSS